jgi:hypothetical protein
MERIGCCTGKVGLLNINFRNEVIDQALEAEVKNLALKFRTCSNLFLFVTKKRVNTSSNIVYLLF